MARSVRSAGAKDIYDANAARKIEVRQPERQTRPRKRENLIRLNEKQLRQARRKNVNPFQVLKIVSSVAVCFVLVAYVIYGQVQLTELTNEIETSQTQLTELQSVQIQLEMDAASGKNSEDLEAYAKNVLGMTKINNDQVTYVSLAHGDQAVLANEDSGKNIFEKLWNTVSSWLE